MDTEILAKHLNRMIRDEAAKLSAGNDEYKDKYLNLVSDIKHMKQTAEQNYSNAKEDGLSVNMIELEGYLRAVKDLLTYVEVLEI